MNKFCIKFWEDNQVIVARINGSCLDLNNKYGNIECQFIEYQKILNNEPGVIETTDLFIFDLLDEANTKSLIGLELLEYFKNSKINVPVIVYTTATNSGGNALDFYSYEIKYPNVVFIKKSEDADTSQLKNEIDKIIKNSLDNQFEVNSDYINEFKQQLNFFGLRKINEILFDVKTHYNIPVEHKLKLLKLKSGFSGAILFKFSFNNTDYVLKISKDISLIENELSKAKAFYPLFPTKFFNYIDPKVFQTSSKDTIAIVIKLIQSSRTLFEFIINSTSHSSIELIFNEIYNNFGLKLHYSNQKSSTDSWTIILNKFKDGWFNTIKEVYKELNPLLINFNLTEVQNFIEKDDFKNLNPIKLTHKGTITLNHLDLHSKNILVQGEKNTFLIDTGVMDYGYWCFDICRLLVDLLINGIDIDSKDFFDINSISKNIKIGQNLIKRETIHYDSKNDRIIDSINWLTINVSDIYSDYFTLWEFQLGLMKEFLQMSYRTGSVPHSKRALTLELAYICMLEAEKNTSK